MAAGPAGCKGVIAAPIHQQNGLLPCLQILLQFGTKTAANGSPVARRVFFAQVDCNDLRKDCISIAFVQNIERIPSALSGGIALHRWRGGGKDQQRILLGAAKFCHVARMIAR